MTRPSLEEIQNSFDDPLQADKYIVRIAYVPGAGLGSLNNRDLTVHCSNVTWPSTGIQPVSVELLGHTFNFAGKSEEPDPITMTFFENRGMPIYKKLRSWKEYIRNTDSAAAGSPKNIGGINFGALSTPGYVTTIAISVLDSKNLEQTPLILQNAWLQNIASFDLGDQNLIQINATFQYDSHYFGQSSLGLGSDLSSFF